MQSGKILPVVRQFFSVAPKAGNAHRDADPQQGQQRSPERDATEEEAARAAELLSGSEEFKKSGLTARVVSHNGKAALTVCDRSGTQLRMIQNHEILRILISSIGEPKGPRQGRILDRRI